MDTDKARNYFQIATDRMFTAIESYYLWKKIASMMNVNEVGQEVAEKNVEILKRHWNFFHPVQVNALKGFVVDLSVFFDAEKYEDTFSVGKLIEDIKLKVSEVEYKDLLQKIQDIKRRHGVDIAFILELRNMQAVHQEIDRKERSIVFKEIEDLFAGVQEILNLLRKYYDGSYTVWDHIGKDVENGVDWVIGNLEKGEKARIEEIGRKWSL